MSGLPHRLRPNAQEVAAEVIDDEAIIINLSNGIYYSMSKAGAIIWAGIERACTLEEIVTDIVARYEVSPEQAQADLDRLAGELLQENLVIVASDETSVRRNPEPGLQEKLPYEPPRLNVYRDMGDLLALDPPLPTLKDIPWKAPTDPSSS